MLKFCNVSDIAQYGPKSEILTFNVKYEIVLYTPVFNARWGVSVPHKNDDVIYEQPLNPMTPSHTQ